jgi:hypothetical protein
VFHDDLTDAIGRAWDVLPISKQQKLRGNSDAIDRTADQQSLCVATKIARQFSDDRSQFTLATGSATQPPTYTPSSLSYQLSTLSLSLSPPPLSLSLSKSTSVTEQYLAIILVTELKQYQQLVETRITLPQWDTS